MDDAVVAIALVGANQAAVRRRLQELREECDAGTGMLSSNLTTLDGTPAPADVIAAASTAPFLAPSRLVVVPELLDRFEQRAESRSSRTLDAWEPFFRWVDDEAPPWARVVFLGTGTSKRNPFLKRLASCRRARIEEFPELRGEALLRFVREEAAARGVRFRRTGQRPEEGDPAYVLVTNCNGDTLALLNELDKLALYAEGREVTVDDVQLLCPGERTASVWHFIDAALDGDLGQALRSLRGLRQTGESEQGVLALLASGVRQLVTILDLLDEGKSEEEIGVAINRPFPNLRRRAIDRARRLGREGVAAAYDAIVEADRSLKSGAVDEDLAMEVLVAKLAGLARRPVGRVRG